MLYGGSQLLFLQGSAYYAFAGVCLLFVAIALWRRSSAAAYGYLGFLALSCVWAWVESGWFVWALLPRLSLISGLGLCFALPWIRNDPREVTSSSRTATFAVSGLSALVLVGLIILGAATYREPASSSLAAADLPGASAEAASWMSYGGNAGGNRFSPATQITPRNVDKLRVAWTFRTGEKPTPGGPAIMFEATPLAFDGALYFCTGKNVVFALDQDTGKQLWRFDPKVDTGGVPAAICRGLAVATLPDVSGPCAQRLVMATIDDRLIALDPKSGQRCQDFGSGADVNLTDGLGFIQKGFHYSTSPPTIVGSTIVVGSIVPDNQTNNEAPGVVRGFDLATGKLLWGWDVVSPTGSALNGAPPSYRRDTPNAWSVFSADEKLGLIYLPTGNAPPDFFGGGRSPEQGRYSSSVVALDVRTGDVRWSFQTVHHDVWDYDVGSQPVLFDFPVGKQRVPALAAATKRGEIFILDRATGKPLTAVEERAVPQNGAAGEALSPTQPYSVGFPSFAPRPLSEQSMWGITPLDQLWCRLAFRKLRYDGDFTPPSTQGSLVFPGSFGAINWGSLSIDPDRQIMTVNSTGMPFIVRLIPRKTIDELGIEPYNVAANGGAERGIAPQAGTPYGVSVTPFLSPIGMPCQQPQWGELSAVDLRKREIMWSRPLGTTRGMLPLNVAFPVGMFNMGGSVTTRSGLVFIGATLDNQLRAFDISNGRELWKSSLPAGAHATPMTFVSRRSGRQYVVVAAGGHGALGGKLGDYVVAYSL